MNVVLPNLYDNYKTNIAFLDYWFTNEKNITQFPEERMYFYAFGNFPQASYAAEKNNTSRLALYDTINSMLLNYKQHGASIILDCGSPLVQEFNRWDNFGYAALDILSNFPDAYVTVSTDFMYDYIQSKFPNYSFIKTLLYTGDKAPADFFLEIHDSQHLPENINKSKTLLQINKICSSCEKQSFCCQKELLNISTFSSQSVYPNCNRYGEVSNHLILHEELSQFYSQGFKNFLLPDYSFLATPIPQITEYVKDLIKSNFTIDAINQIAQKRERIVI